MSKTNNLLNENTIKRFMKLSSLNGFTNTFLDKVDELETLQEEDADERHTLDSEPNEEAPGTPQAEALDGEAQVKGLEQVEESVSVEAAKVLAEQPLPEEEGLGLPEEEPMPGEEMPMEAEDVLGEPEAELEPMEEAPGAAADAEEGKVEQYIADLVTYAVNSANDMFDLGLELDLEEGPGEEAPEEAGLEGELGAELGEEPMPEEEAPLAIDEEPLPEEEILPEGKADEVSDTLVDQVLKRVTKRLQEMAATQAE